MHEPQPIDFAPTLEAIISLLPPNLQRPNLGIICGSGLSGLAEDFRQVVIVPYEKIPGFGHSSGPSSRLSLLASSVLILNEQSLDTRVHLPLAFSVPERACQWLPCLGG